MARTQHLKSYRIKLTCSDNFFDSVPNQKAGIKAATKTLDMDIKDDVSLHIPCSMVSHMFKDEQNPKRMQASRH